MAEKEPVSIWFFIGVLLTVYGVLIFGYGLYAFNAPPAEGRVLQGLHADVWWGLILLFIGLAYSVKFAPGKER